MKPTLCALTVITCCLAATSSEQPAPADPKSSAIAKSLETFSGTWDIVTVEPPGVTKDARRLVFRKDRTYAALDANGKELWSGTFELDPTATPKIWDHRSTEAQKTGGDALGIYELDGDTLKVACVVGTWKEKTWTGKPRTKEFKLPAADVVLVLKRVNIGK